MSVRFSFFHRLKKLRDHRRSLFNRHACVSGFLREKCAVFCIFISYDIRPDLKRLSQTMLCMQEPLKLQILQEMILDSLPFD